VLVDQAFLNAASAGTRLWLYLYCVGVMVLWFVYACWLAAGRAAEGWQNARRAKVTIDIQTWPPKTRTCPLLLLLVLSFYFLSLVFPLVYAHAGYSLALYKLCLYQHLLFFQAWKEGEHNQFSAARISRSDLRVLRGVVDRRPNATNNLSNVVI